MPALYIGLLSGTSMDGIDAALVDLSSPKPALLATHSMAWPPTVREQLATAKQLDDQAVYQLESLDIELADLFADAALELLKTADTPADAVKAIGSHGQTIRHRPDAAPPFSLQLADGQRIADRTGILTISDFRTADIEAGGEGAPLASAFHNAVMRTGCENRCVINIGGIANVTLLPADENLPVVGFDTGPGNNLMDGWIHARKGLTYDDNGTWARSGTLNDTLLQAMLADPYFRLPPPKSTGFEHFNMEWLSRFEPTGIAPEDIQATLCELTASTIADAIRNSEIVTQHALVCGGGAHNAFCLERLQARLPDIPVDTTEVLGIPPDWMEAMAFAWLAQQHLEGKPGNLPSVTGARDAIILGKYHSPQRQARRA